MRCFTGSSQAPSVLHVVGKNTASLWRANGEGEWNVFLRILAEWFDDVRFRCHAFVLMNNHYHLLTSTFAFQYERDGALKYLHELIHRDEHWQTPVQLGDSPYILEIDTYEGLKKNYCYIYRNPIRAGLVKRAEDYPLSTLPFVLGLRSDLPFWCSDPMNVIYHPRKILSEINEHDDSPQSKK